MIRLLLLLTKKTMQNDSDYTDDDKDDDRDEHDDTNILYFEFCYRHTKILVRSEISGLYNKVSSASHERV